jgi:hypothetical protein
MRIEIDHLELYTDVLSPKDLVVGRTLTPTPRTDSTLMTGFAIIFSVKGDTIKVLTDFGNLVTLSESEVIAEYKKAPRGVDNVKERISKQIELLSDALILFEGE